MEKYAELYSINQYHPSLIANFDETFVSRGKKHLKVIVKADDPKRYINFLHLSCNN